MIPLLSRHPLPWTVTTLDMNHWIVDANGKAVVMGGRDDVEWLAEIVNRTQRNSEYRQSSVDH